MEEKKLTDEEWFEQYAKNARSVEETYCEQLGCGGTADDAVEREIEFDRHLIAYVKRLQQRVSILEADNDDYNMKLAENELVSIDLHNEQVGHLEEENAELKKQVREFDKELNLAKSVLSYDDEMPLAKWEQTIRKETAEKFAERLKDEVLNFCGTVEENGYFERSKRCFCDDIDEICKELIGGK